jgi:hypothetical protein
MTDDAQRFKEIKADHEARVFTRQSLEQHRAELIAMVERLTVERDHYVAHHQRQCAMHATLDNTESEEA